MSLTDPPLSVSTLQLLVPPLRLMSACMWQVAQHQSSKHYGQLEEFVCLVTQTIPQVLTHRKKTLLILGLRAKIMFEQFNVENTCDIQAFLNKIGSFQIIEASDVEAPVAEFLKFSQTVLANQEESQHFLQEVFLVEFKPHFDAALLSLVCDFLSQLEERLPVPNFKQVASFFNGNSYLDNGLWSGLHTDNLKSLLESHRCFLKFDRNADKSAPVHLPSPAGSRELSSVDLSTLDTGCLSSYQCPQCGKNFAYQFQLVNHQQVHKEGGQFKCFECGKTFRFSTSLSNHKKTLCKQVAYSCLKCGDGFTSFRLKLAHRCSSNHPVQATEGRKSQEKQTFDCQKCGMSFRFFNSFKYHVEWEHRLKRSSRQKVQESALDIPVATETKEDTRNELDAEDQRTPLQCSHCPKSFSRAEELKIHLESHQPLDCHKCGKSFANLSNLVLHVQQHEVQAAEKKGKPRSVSLSSSSKTSSQNSLLCGHCDMSFAGVNELQDHRRAHNIEDQIDCHKCGMSFTDLASLVQHVNQHNTNTPTSFLCHQCGKLFRSNGYLKQHMKIHSNDRAHCCSYCGKCFSQRGNLTVHIRLHTGEKPYTCMDCGKSFPSAGELQVHRRFHTRTKPYQCKECNARFFTASHLGLHMRNHRGERPHACPVCGKRFLRPTCLRNHLLVHSGLRAFSCPHCSKMFKRKSHLSSHIKNNHQRHEPEHESSDS